MFRSSFTRIAAVENLLVFTAVALAVSALCGGIYVAWYTRDPHWVNRSGAAIVAVQALVIVADFLRRARLQKLREAHLSKVPHATLPRDSALKILNQEIEKAESFVLFIAILLAVAGEILHGFGDILIGPFLN